jgi:hypothetical protein
LLNLAEIHINGVCKTIEGSCSWDKNLCANSLKELFWGLFQTGMQVGIGEPFSSLNKIRQRCNNMADRADLETAKDRKVKR